MNIFDVFKLIGGLAMFLFGMNIMGGALEKCAGSRLKSILGSMTSSPFRGFLLGLGVTAVIQSSSATTVMVVGFVNSGIMSLRQAIGIILGANLGTSVTSWILSLTAIDGQNFFIQLLKPSSFVPVLALIGVVLYLFQKNSRRRDIGLILLGFSVLMFGMETMSDSVRGLSNVPQFGELLLLFSNPLFGVLVGAVLTAIIQSSSASVGILQALANTGKVTCAAAIPIVMGQNIGTCITAMISSVGTSKNARRTAVVHLFFNLIATVILLFVYCMLDLLIDLPFDTIQASELSIAIIHTSFNLLALMIIAPCTRLLEKIACLIVRDGDKDDTIQLLDERLLSAPSVAIERCRTVTVSMAEIAAQSIAESISTLAEYNEKTAEKIRSEEEQVDMYEDKLGSYIVKLSSLDMSEADSAEVNKLLHLIGDFERISDHALNILDSAQEIRDKQLEFSGEAKKELSVLTSAVAEIIDLSLKAFRENNLDEAVMVEPLEQVVDYLSDYLKKQHIARLRRGECTIELGFVLTDLLTNLERISDHCSNIAGCLLEIAHEDMDVHEYLRSVKGGDIKEYNDYYDYFKMKYTIKNV